MEGSHIGFLIHDVARLYRRRFDEATRRFGITGPQMRALVAVMRNPGINQGALAEKLDVEPITTCRMIDRLEQAGLIERRRDPADRRAWRLHLSDSANPITSKMHAVGEDVLAESIIGLDTQALESMVDCLNAIRVNLDKALAAASDNEKAQTHG